MHTLCSENQEFGFTTTSESVWTSKQLWKWKLNSVSYYIIVPKKAWVKTFVWQLVYGSAPWGTDDGYSTPPPCHLSGSIVACCKSHKDTHCKETETRKSAFRNHSAPSSCHKSAVWESRNALNYMLLKKLSSSLHIIVSELPPAKQIGKFFS